MATRTAATRTQKGATFDSVSPATGEVLGSYPLQGEPEARAAVVAAREAALWWSSLGFAGRRTRLKAWAAHLARHLDELVEVVHRENGKPRSDAALEASLAIDHVAWAAKNAGKVLREKRVPSGLVALNQTATLAYPPLGVIGVIGPWNYPVFTPMGSIAYALAAGNAVVFKPSEHTPGVGEWLVRSFEQAVPGPPVLQLLTGDGGAGAALCRAGVDKLAFTGSAATGRKVMAACAEGLVPVLMELGGKDAMVVAEDADLEAAVDAALWGGMSNAGQTCAGIERVYVVDPLYDPFVRRLVERAGELRAGEHYGPITMPGQVDVIRRHLADAVARGGRVLVGGSIEGNLVEPTVLVDVPEDSAAVQEETFGPTLTVARVADLDEAVRLTNGTAYGLSASVFSRRRGREVARRLRTGMASVNDVIAFASVPSLPFGGVGASGFGRIHGADGLREFARPQAVTSQRFALPRPVASFRRDARTDKLLATMVTLLHGRG